MVKHIIMNVINMTDIFTIITHCLLMLIIIIASIIIITIIAIIIVILIMVVIEITKKVQESRLKSKHVCFIQRTIQSVGPPKALYTDPFIEIPTPIRLLEEEEEDYYCYF